MRRLHLLEIEDQPWCPPLLRDFATDFLQFAIHVGDSYAPAAPLIRAELETLGSRTIVDLCSGGGGPWARLLPALERDGPVDLELTDLFPSREAGARLEASTGGRARYHADPVDAANVPVELPGLRTIFSGFHHFDPERARQLLRDAVDKGQPIAIFEATERSAKGISLILPSPIFVLLSTPFIRPFHLTRLLFTYVIPLIPIFVLWDGIVSALRTYRPEEMLLLAKEADPGGRFTWTAGSAAGSGPGDVGYLIGRPAE